MVVWKTSVESIREWTRKARLDVYDDPSYHRLCSLPLNGRSLVRLLELAEESTSARTDGEGLGGLTRHVAVARPQKKEERRHLKLPSAVAELSKHLVRAAETGGEGPWARVRLRAGLRSLEVLGFLRVHGMVGLGRWILARLSPRRRVALLAMRRRALADSIKQADSEIKETVLPPVGALGSKPQDVGRMSGRWKKRLRRRSGYRIK